MKVILSIESGNKGQKKQPAQKKSYSTAPAVVAKTHQLPSNTGPDPSRLATALSIIAEESGLSVADLTETTVFADVGIDSLLGLTISARFKEELDMEFEFNAFFFDYPTVRDLKTLFGDSGAV